MPITHPWMLEVIQYNPGQNFIVVTIKKMLSSSYDHLIAWSGNIICFQVQWLSNIIKS